MYFRRRGYPCLDIFCYASCPVTGHGLELLGEGRGKMPVARVDRNTGTSISFEHQEGQHTSTWGYSIVFIAFKARGRNSRSGRVRYSNALDTYLRCRSISDLRQGLIHPRLVYLT